MAETGALATQLAQAAFVAVSVPSVRHFKNVFEVPREKTLDCSAQATTRKP